MGVYIKGMAMPTLYRTYKVRFSESGDGKIIVGIANEDSTAYRPIGEVIPVPPHGRLIDADALIENCMKEDGFLAEMLFRKVNNAPTIIPAEEGE